MGLAFRQPEFEAFQDGTAAAIAPVAAEPFSPIGTPEEAGAERRGPLRPNGLALSRQRLRRWTLRALFRLADAGALLGTAWLAAAIATSRTHTPLAFPAMAPFLAAFAILLWALGAFDSYGLGAGERLGRHLTRLFAACGLAAATLGLAVAAFGAAGSIEPMALWFTLSLAVLVCLHLAWWTRVRSWRRDGRLTANIIVVGATANAGLLVRRLLASGEAAVLGVFDDRLGRAPGNVGGVPVLGDTDALIGHKIMPYVDKIVITVPSVARARVRELVDRLAVLPNDIMLFVDHDSQAGREAAFSRIIEAPLAQVSGRPSDERRALVKRVQDLAVGTLALILCLPVMAVVAFAIRLDSPGPILFRQRRHGFNNEPILVCKFRSMRAEALPGATLSAERQVCVNDERITRVGRLIRRTSLDELPQIFNVLKGEMSLVGPRPHAVGMKTGETESALLVARYAHRHRMKPGVTGWAAIHGSRGPVDTAEAVRRRVALDIEYIERQSFWLDLMIMAMTIPCLLGDCEAVR
ncbi:MAG TPA: exopolysaccharide biosynthesis polyprenyl glycosylphosphotransferase [Caulobacteraceae bacterium]